MNIATTGRPVLPARAGAPAAASPVGAPGAGTDKLCYGLCCKVRSWCRHWLELDGTAGRPDEVMESCGIVEGGVPVWPRFVDVRIEGRITEKGGGA